MNTPVVLIYEVKYTKESKDRDLTGKQHAETLASLWCSHNENRPVLFRPEELDLALLHVKH